MTKQVSAEQPELDPAEALEIEVDEAIALCGGDVRAALRATLLANAFLEQEVEQLVAQVSRGFARGKPRRKSGVDTEGGREVG